MSDTIAPTLERERHAAWGIDAPEVGQKVERRAFKIRDIWQALQDRGQITDDEATAGRTFAKHLELAYRGRAITPSYGQRFAEGTPLAQQSGTAAEDDTARVVDYVRLHVDARNMLPASARLAVCAAAEGRTLEQIGKLLGGAKMVAQQRAAASMAIKCACELLLSHYQPRKQKVPW